MLAKRCEMSAEELLMRSPRALTLLIFTIIAACLSAVALTAADSTVDVHFGEPLGLAPSAR